MRPADPRPARSDEPRRSERPGRNLVGVRLAPHGRALDMDAGELRLEEGEQVLVDDRRGGTLIGRVSVASGLRQARGQVGRVIRRVDARDLERIRADEVRHVEALAFARERAHERQLEIKVFRVEFALAGDKTTFYFSSEQRVDFRELVRDLAAKFHNRIELRQVGVRDEAKMVGGIGSCGRELCCTTFLPHFAPVTIRMAKNQNLALNPTRVSGQCGRLKCCLVYEEAQYIEASRSLPRIGKRVETPDGVGRVDDLDVLRGRVRVSFPDRPPETYEGAQLKSLAGAPQETGPAAKADPATPPDDPQAPHPPKTPVSSDEPGN